MDLKFKIIKKETLDQLNAALENEKKACTELLGKYQNLHRLHNALWEKYQKELGECDDRINELQAQLRKSEHQRKELEKKLKKQAQYQNLHRLHNGLWKKYQSELSESDDRINELQAELRKSEHQRKELEKKLKKYETR